MSIIGRITTAGLLLLALAGCDESPVSLPEASSVAVSGSAMALAVGEQAPVAAQVLDQDGRVMEGMAPVFSTDNPSVATVSSDGMVRGVGPGAANVTAAYGTGSAVVKVTVTASAARVAVPVTAMALAPGDGAPLGAQVLNQHGQPVPGAAVVYSTDNPAVATVGTDGMVRGVGPGTANVTAAYGSSTAAVRVTVVAGATRVTVPATAMALAPGDGAPLGAQVLNEHGQPVPGAAVVYSTDNPTVATVGTDGMVRAVGPGTANVTAAYGSSTAVVRVTVVAGVTRVTVPATTMSLVAGDDAPLGAQVLNQHGQPVPGAVLVYSTDNPGVVAVGPNGTVRGVSPGVANVTAAFGSGSASVRVTVVPNTRQEVATLDVLADSLVTDRRAGVQAVAFRATNGYGQAVCPTLTVRSSDPSVATARNAGTCRIEVVPAIAGETTITVEADGRTDSFRLRVTALGAVSFFSARPSADQLVAGATVSYTVKVLDQSSRPIVGQRVNFEVGVGGLSADAVVTGEDGTATVQWQIPTELRELGQTSWIGYRTTMPGGSVAGRTEEVFINGASLAEITLYGARGFMNTAGLRPLPDGTFLAPSYTTVMLGASGRDQYGNVRVADFTFSVQEGLAFFDCSPAGSRTSAGIEYTCIWGYPGTVRVRAQAETGEQRTITVTYN